MQDHIKLKYKKVEVQVFLLGCMMVPRFNLGEQFISPLHICKWKDKDKKKLKKLPGILKNLSGDFPCVPFGINTPIENISEEWKQSYSESPYLVNEPHGFAANNRWDLKEISENHATFKIIYPKKDNIESLTRIIRITDSEKHTINCTLKISVKQDCQLPIGFHPIINLPEEKNKIKIFPGKFKYGLTYPGLFLPGRNLGAIGTKFESINEVKGHDGKNFDLSKPPFEGNYEDLFQLCGIDGNISIENYLDNYRFSYSWNPDHFTSLLIWISNKGRLEYPWNENTLTMGLEPVTSAFGLSTYVSGNPINPINANEVSTIINFKKNSEWITNYSFSLEKI